METFEEAPTPPETATFEEMTTSEETATFEEMATPPEMAPFEELANFEDLILADADRDMLHRLGRLYDVKSKGPGRNGPEFIHHYLIHLRCLHPAADKRFQRLPLPTTPADPHAPSFNESHFVKIPRNLMSRATLRYMGMEHDASIEGWNDWFGENVKAERAKYPPSPLKPHATRKMVKDFPLVFKGRYDIINSFVRLDLETNVDKKLQRAILDLLHTKTRETNSCQYWAYHSGEMRYCELEEIQRTSRERARIIEGIGPRDADSFFQDHAVPVDGPNYCAPRLEDATWTQAVAASLKNHDSDVTVLYKVIDIGHISGFWTRDTNGNNTYDLAKLVDDWFVSSKNVFATHNGISQGKIVFHEYIHTAEAEAAYAWRRATRSGSIAILTLTLRNNDIRQLERSRRDAVMYQRWTKSDWKLYTWYCMSKIWVPQNMPHLQRYSNADLLIRTMAHREFEHYASIRGENDLRTHKPKEFLYVPEELGRWGRVRRRFFRREPREYIFRSNETTLSFLLEKGTFNAYLVTSTNIKAMPKIQQLKRVNWQFGTLETDQCDRDMEEDEDEDEVEHDLWDEYYPVLDSDIDMGD